MMFTFAPAYTSRVHSRDGVIITDLPGQLRFNTGLFFRKKKKSKKSR